MSTDTSSVAAAVSVAICTLGCKTNQCDADALVKLLFDAGFIIKNFDQVADIYLINTCTVTHTGDKKSLQMIRRARRLNLSAFVAVCGCMPRSQADSIAKITTAGADFVFDTREPDVLLAKLANIYPLNTHNSKKNKPEAILNQDLLSRRTRSFIKIQDGCNRYCTYCIVPYVRGQLVSYPVNDILTQAKEHTKNRVLEIVLTGIQVAGYGYDTDSGHVNFPNLVKLLTQLNIPRIRLSSIDPWAVDDDFLEAISTPTICSHFHLSLQSGSDRTLRRMNRSYTTSDYKYAANKLRALRPDVGLTTDIIVGFPGETDDDFKESLNFVNDMAFSQIHVFEYSPRAGTPAATYPDQVQSTVKAARSQTMRATAQGLKQQFLQAQVGTIANVLFESPKPSNNPHKANNIWQGLTENYCTIKVQGENLSNTIQKVLITGVAEDGLTGEI